MAERINIGSGSSWEDAVGYSRAVIMENIIEISGTVAVDNGSVVGSGDAYKQAHFILTKIQKILIEAGSDLSQVIRTRMFVTDITQWQEIGKAHGEFFGTIKPATSMVQVSALIDPEYLVEIEATAYLS